MTLKGGFDVKEQLNGNYWDKIDGLAILSWRFSVIYWLISLVVSIIVIIIFCITMNIYSIKNSTNLITKG